MIRRNFNDMSDAERVAATPHPEGQLVSMGERTTWDTEFTNHGQRQVPVTYEVLVEWRFGGGGRRMWYRFKNRPNELVAQFDTTPAPPPNPPDEYTPEERAAFRAMLPAKDAPIPDPPLQILFEKPSW